MIVEGNTDVELVAELGISKRHIINAGGEGEVCNQLSKKERTIGLIDEDPGKTHPSYVDHLKFIMEENDVILKFDEIRQNYLIILCPRLEEWILKAASVVGIDVSNYNLPKNPDVLHQYLRTYPVMIIPLVKELRNKDSKMQNGLENMIMCLTRILTLFSISTKKTI